MEIVFVIPGDNRSGGVRVTVYMANQLLALGHNVRLAIPKNQISLKLVKNFIKNELVKNFSKKRTGWIYMFKGKIEYFKNINEIYFGNNEIVIAVGTFAISYVYDIKKDVKKIRYNHGILTKMSEKENNAWKIKMPTITVSKTIIPDLERLTRQKVLDVIPNGISTSEYYVLHDIIKNGIGSVYSEDPVKGPELLISILKKIKKRSPLIPIYLFGADKLPKLISAISYVRYPTIQEANKIYNKAKIWLVTSHSEGFPGPILEAMACGCVVISSDTYGGRELIKNGLNGFLVNKGDVDGFLEIIEYVIENPDLYDKIRKETAKTVKKYSWKKAAEKMDSFLTGYQEKRNNLL